MNDHTMFKIYIFLISIVVLGVEIMIYVDLLLGAVYVALGGYVFSFILLCDSNKKEAFQ